MGIGAEKMMLVPKEKRENGYRREKNDASTQKKFKYPAESFAGRHISQRKV